MVDHLGAPPNLLCSGRLLQYEILGAIPVIFLTCSEAGATGLVLRVTEPFDLAGSFLMRVSLLCENYCFTTPFYHIEGLLSFIMTNSRHRNASAKSLPQFCGPFLV